MQPRQLWKNQRLTATNGRSSRRLLVLTLALTICAGVLRLTYRSLGRFTVSGRSMEPALSEADRLLVLRLPAPLLRLRPGVVVLARSPAAPGLEVIKRVAEISCVQGRIAYVLLGDNPFESTDSRHFGSVPASSITGRVLYRYWPDERRGVVPVLRQAGSDTPPLPNETRSSRASPSSSSISHSRSDAV